MKTNELIDVFLDTQSRIEKDLDLKKKTADSSRRTKLYDEGFFHEKKVKSSGWNVVIWEGTSFQCAKKFSNGNDTVAVLNFANPFEPGGGVRRGASAQEECLCRCSNLFNCISQPRIIEGYYNYHNADKHNYLFSDKIVYSPGIVVFKDDSTYEILHDPFFVDVVTCAAPYNVYGHDNELLKETYTKRLTNIFEVSAENDVDVLVLGAFGCGVFHNPPELMAETFRALIKEKYSRFFKKICFPLKRNGVSRNFEVFSQILTE